MVKSPKINDCDPWHVTPCSTAFFERIPNLYLVWSNSVILPVKSTSNRFFVVKNGKIPTDSWIMTCDPLFDCIFQENSESVLSLVKFGQIIGQMHVNPARQLVRNGEVPQVTWIMSCGALLHCVFEEDYESVLNLTLSGQFTGKMHVKSVSIRFIRYSQEKNCEFARKMVNSQWFREIDSEFKVNSRNVDEFVKNSRER